MLRSMKDMEDCTIGATDGIIGRVRDFYFDDGAWVIRYLVVDAGEAGPRRRVLISPTSIGQPNWSEGSFPSPLRESRSQTAPTSTPISRCRVNKRWAISATTATVAIGAAGGCGAPAYTPTSCRRDYSPKNHG